MKILTSTVLLTPFILILLLSYSSLAYAKKHCKPFQQKLHDIQAMQRNAYSNKRGNSLRNKEDKARDKWWQCEKLSLAKFNDKYGIKTKNTTKKSAKKSTSKNTDNKAKTVKKGKSKSRSTKYKVPTYSQQVPTFNQTSAIVIRTKYQGNKQIAWLDFYNLPSKCKQPKDLSDFAYCNEHKRQQQSEFEGIYTE